MIRIGKLKELRKRKKLSQTEVAEKLGVSLNTISNYERGERTPDVKTLNELAKLYDVSVDYLIENEETKSAEEWFDEVASSKKGRLTAGQQRVLKELILEFVEANEINQK